MRLAAEKMRDSVNEIRSKLTLDEQVNTDGALKPFQKDFIAFAIKESVLQFGNFKLKSGRLSPYFFNAGLFCSGYSLMTLSRCYARAIKDAGINFDVIFGPAYKGIPLTTAISIAWYELFGESKDVAYNRKEAKDHGEVRQ